MKLPEFFTRMDRHEEQVPLGELVDLLAQLDITCDDVADTIRFDEEHYARNVLRAGPGYAALLLCWRPGQKSPIHDHSGSACGVRVLQGIVTETRYERGPDGLLVESGTASLRAGLVCGSFDTDIHVIANEQSTGHDLVTLHIYTPPLNDFNVYSLESPEIEVFSEALSDAVKKRLLASAPSG